MIKQTADDNNLGTLFYERGHDIKTVCRGSSMPDKLHIPTEVTGENEGRAIESVRPLGLRGPIVIVGWGYDKQGFPVPNKDGDGGTSCYFKDNWLNNPQEWKAGPLDVRWDYTKQMWVANTDDQDAQGFIVYAKLLSDLEPGGTALAETVEETGQTPSQIQVTNRMGQPLCNGQHVFAYHNPYGCEWVVIQAEFMPVCVVTDLKADLVESSDSSQCLDLTATTRIIYTQSPPTIGVETRWAQVGACGLSGGDDDTYTYEPGNFGGDS